MINLLRLKLVRDYLNAHPNVQAAVIALIVVLTVEETGLDAESLRTLLEALV